MTKILILDDDEQLGELLQNYLQKFGFETLYASHPDQGLQLALEAAPDLMTLDVMMPGKDGFEVLKELRKTSQIPVIMLTARGELTDRVVGLEIGADDYLAKPFEPRELVARIQTILRRSRPGNHKKLTLEYGELKIDLAKHEVTLGAMALELTSTEYELLRLLAQHPGEVMSRDRILTEVSGIEWESFNRSIDVLVSRLRQKLHDDPKHPKYLKTVWGSGYLFLGQANL